MMHHFPEVKDLGSDLKQKILALCNLHLVKPQKVLATEFDVQEDIRFVIGGKVDCFRMIKER